MLDGASGSWANLYWPSGEAEVGSVDAVEYVHRGIGMIPDSGAVDSAGMSGEYYGGE